jgi:tetratricopeptide (TPR) repeat protein
MSHRSWLRQHYRYEPAAIRLVLADWRRNQHLPTVAALARAHPKSYNANARLITLLRDAGRLPEALQHWRRNTRNFPRISNPHMQRAVWAIDERNYAEAITWLTRCLLWDRGYFRQTVLFWRAECNLRLGRFSAAAEDLLRLPDRYDDYELHGLKLRTKELVLADVRSRRKTWA